MTKPVRSVAFLRAINVGGHVVKMDVLRQEFESLGLTGVETFIASGNVIFDARAKAAILERKIEAQLEGTLGYRVATFIRSIDELSAVAKTEAFDPSELAAGADLYVGFLREGSPMDLQKKLIALGNRIDDFAVRSREVYWLRRKQLGESVFSGAFIEKTLRAEATLRNITTVRKIVVKYGGGS